MRQKTSLAYYLLLITIVLTNLTQIPDWVGNSVIKLLSYVPWMMLALVIVIKNVKKIYFGNQKYLYVLAIGIMGICGMLEISGRNGFGVALLRPMLMCLFIYVVSLNAGKYIDHIKLNYMLLAYAFSGVVITLFVYQTMLSNGFSWTSRVYAYDSKNSVAQIILTAVFFLIYLHGGKNRFLNLLIDVTVVSLLYALFMLKSRASLLGILLIFIFVLISKKHNRSTKIIVATLSIALLIVLIFNLDFRRFFLDNIVYAGRDSSDLNSLSSGRLDMIKEFPELFSMKPFLGYGRYYVECMPLDAFIETGAIGGILFNIIAVAPVIYAIKAYRKYRQPIDYLLLVVGICYYINGFFEQLAPFGPGVKCYMLWLLFGLSVAWRKKDAYENTLAYKHANNI